MRISDWSSDVCSSDLPFVCPLALSIWIWKDNLSIGAVLPGDNASLPGLVDNKYLVTHFGSSPLSQQASGNTSNESADLIFSIDQADYLNLSVGRRFHLNGRFVCLDLIKWHAKIGRASWRERVCQYG